MVGEGFPAGKLEVFQHSGTHNTTGEFVINTDLSNGVSGAPTPLIGIEGYTSNPNNYNYYNVAGWFEADPYVTTSITNVKQQQYAIFVPGTWNATLGYTTVGSNTVPDAQTRGTVDIGFPFNMDYPDWTLDVDGAARLLATVYPSDSTIKKNQKAFKYGIKAIRNLNPISYKYNGVGGFDTNGTYIGLVAQNLRRNVPAGIVYSLIKKDTTSATDTETIGNVYEEAVLYTVVNAIKEVDSAVTANHTGSFGSCGSTLPALTTNEGINLANNNIYFTGNYSGSLTQNNVIIGNTCSYVPKAKLDIYQHSNDTGSIALYVRNDDSGSSTPNCTTPAIGIESIVPNGGIGTSSQIKVAGYFRAVGTDNCPATPVRQYALWVPDSGGRVAIGFKNYIGSSSPPNYMLDVWGTCYNTNNLWVSDSTLKTQVTPIQNALGIVNNLKGVSYQYVKSAIADTGMSGTHYGFIAQQVSRVLPNAVKKDQNGLEAVAYTEIIPWTVEAIKQEKHTNDSLRSTVDSLRYTIDSMRNAFKNMQTCLNTLCSQGGGHGANHHNSGGGNSGDSNVAMNNIEDVTLSAMSNAPLLYQNVPNPYTSGTKIKYYLPANTQGSSIVFYDTYGNQLKVVQLSQTGNGTLNITPDNLTSGIYSYSLIVNNNVIDTKRMILQK
jgi:hypothetical protein